MSIAGPAHIPTQLLNPAAGENVTASVHWSMKVDGETVWTSGFTALLDSDSADISRIGTDYNPSSTYQNIGGFRAGNFSMTVTNVEIYLGVWSKSQTCLVEFFCDGDVNSSAHSEIGRGSPSAAISGDVLLGKGFRLAVTDDPNAAGTNGSDGEADGGDDGGNALRLPDTSPLLALCLVLAGWAGRRPV